jgi:hypothetical protein
MFFNHNILMFHNASRLDCLILPRFARSPRNDGKMEIHMTEYINSQVHRNGIKEHGKLLKEEGTVSCFASSQSQ